MKRTTVVIMLFMLNACAGFANKQPPDPRELTDFDCSGAVGWSPCFKAAGAKCPNGFDILTKEENLVTGLRSMTIACKK